MNKVTLNLVAHGQDGGDGSYVFSFYNNKEELAKELAAGDSIITTEMIESGDDPYEYGMLTTMKLELEVTPEGVRLAKPTFVSSD